MTNQIENSTQAVTEQPDVDLETILAAWNTATDRLQRTHETLREEVCRLSDELEIKNRELARKNRLADLGQMASHVAHEVRNSLVPIKLYLSLLKRQLLEESETSQPRVDTIGKIEVGFSALEATVSDLLNFTSERDPHYSAFDLRQLAAGTCESLQPQFAAQEIRLVLDIPFGIQVHADQDMLRRAILNLVMNSLDAMPTGGDLVITGVDTGNAVELEVADSGSGFSSENMHRVFEPFFTCKEGGTGLGMAIVYRIAEVHSGSVTAMNCPEGGAAVTIRLPRRTMEQAA